MKIGFLFISLAMAANSFAQNPCGIDSILRNVYKADQEVRQEFNEIINSNDTERILAYHTRMAEADLKNQETVFEILDTFGWPKNLSDSANKAIFLVIDHSELKAQKRYYPLIAHSAAKGILAQSDAATLQDRILMHENKKQIYGTQTVSFTYNGKTECYVWPIKDPEELDTRRTEIGLPPMASYIEMFREMGIDMIWDPSLSIKDLKKKQHKNK